VNYEYGIVSTNQESSATATAIRSLLEWRSTEGRNSRSTIQVNFVPLRRRWLPSRDPILKIK